MMVVIEILTTGKSLPFEVTTSNILFLKAGESTNDQPNENGPNLRLKKLYDDARMNWMRRQVNLKLMLA